jgi:hypothetical protein
MKIAIMQPYFLPYIGYFQLINSVDVFVIYDNVNFIKKGWINRNYFLIENYPKLISIPLEGASQHKLIDKINVKKEKDYQKILKSIESSYSKASNFGNYFPSFKNIFEKPSQCSISTFNFDLMKLAIQNLSVKTEFIFSSNLNIDHDLKGQDKIIEICKKLNASTYINLPGGKGLYEQKIFRQKNINLKFLEPGFHEYSHVKTKKFYSNLSFFDVLMNMDNHHLKKLLNNYKLVK